MTQTAEQGTVVQEQAAKLESGISHTQAAITKAHARQQQLQGLSSHLKQRVRYAIAAIDTILSASGLPPEPPAAPDPPYQGTC